MKKWTPRAAAIFALLLAANGLAAQDFALKHHTFIGAEAGMVSAANSPYNQISAGAAAVGEYYLGKHWSLVLRLRGAKYHLNAYRPERKSASSHSGMGPNFGGMFDLDAQFVDYESTNLMTPLSIKWNVQFLRTSYFYLRTGPGLNFRLNAQYQNSDNLGVNQEVVTPGWESGLGLQYRFKNNGMLVVDFSHGVGPAVVTFESFILPHPTRANNWYMSIGYQWLMK